MATAKQLAALAKGREARAKKLAKKAPARKKAPTKKVVRRKNPVRKLDKNFVVQVRTSRNKTGYLTEKATLDTDLKCAILMTEKTAEKHAINFFNAFNKHLLWVKVVKLKK